MRSGQRRATALVLSVVLDAALADPARWHPVAGFGRVAGRIERRWWRDDKRAGVGYAALCVGIPAVSAALAQRLLRSRPLLSTIALAGVTWSTLGGASLRREGRRLAGLLQRGDVDAARVRLSYLCGRDPSGLGPDDLARATVESVAENTADAVVGPLLWAAVAGLPGAVAYRSINTLDAMVGHRTPRYSRFGWAAARLDDTASLVPARVTSALTCLLAPVVGGRQLVAARVLARDGGVHPSPNAGRCEAAFAGALGVQLGGTNVYGGRVEQRGPQGDGPAPIPADIERAARLSAVAGVAAAVLAALAVTVSTPRPVQKRVEQP